MADSARLTNILVITPLRVAFLVVLVGTMFEVLTRRTREQLRRNRWSSHMTGHTIVIGYGTKGYTAVRRLLAQGADPGDFVVMENSSVLRRAGVDAVITSSEAAGRLLGVAAQSPAISEVFNDLLVHGEGLDLIERPARPDEVGKAPSECDAPVIAVLRDGHALPYGQVPQLRAGDQLVMVTSP
jgi:voltage-gated potassium channel